MFNHLMFGFAVLFSFAVLGLMIFAGSRKSPEEILIEDAEQQAYLANITREREASEYLRKKRLSKCKKYIEKE